MNQELLERYILGKTNDAENLTVQEWLKADNDHREEYLRIKNVYQSYLYAMNKELLERYIVGETNDAEASIVQDWLEKDANNRALYVQMKKLWNSLPQPLEVPDVNVDKAWADFKVARDRRSVACSDIPKKQLVRMNWNWWAAASVVLVCIVGFYVFDRSHRVDRLLSSHDLVQKGTLPDGSVVTLNKNTELSYASAWTSTRRNVVLQKGEVFFEVHRDKKHPFVIATGHTTITVLGTSFNVRRMNHTTEVIVATGLVKVNYADKEIFLRPQQMLTLRDSDTATVEKKPVHDAFYKYYVDRQLVFENTPLSRVVDLLERAYDCKIIIDHPEDQKLLLTAKFEQNSLNEIIKVLARTFDFKATMRDREIHLTR